MNGNGHAETITIQRPDSIFVRFTDWVSYFMGTPINISVWLLIVIAWILAGALFSDLFTKGTFLPGWIASNSWNFPLNSATTVVELYIGFLVAAASNRSERRLTGQVESTEKIASMILKVENGEIDILKDHKRLLEENTILTREVRQLQQSLDEANTRELREHRELLEENTRLTRAMEELTRELHTWAKEARPV